MLDKRTFLQSSFSRYTLLVLLLVTTAACRTSGPAKPPPQGQDVSAAPDTVAADTSAVDPTAHDTIVVEAAAPDTIVAETTAPKTTVADTTAPDTIAAGTTKKADKSAYGDIVGEAEKTATGLLNIYYKDQKLYFEIPFDLLGQDMLLSSTISEISNYKLGTVGAKPNSPLHIQFSRVDSVLLLQEINKDAIAPEGNPGITEALARNSIGSVIESFDIKAYNEDNTAAVIEVTDFFISDTEKLSPFGPVGMHISSSMIAQKSFKKNRSFIGEFKSFQDNLTIKSHLSYEYRLKEQGGASSDNNPFTAVMTRTLLLLPEDPMRPRIADPRVGIFTTRKNKYTDSADKVEAVHYARRFRVKPADMQAFENGKGVEPAQPITFYVDTDFPDSWRQTIKAGIADWNDTFEKIGFKNAVRALDYPENDPEFDPDNLKYNVVRYDPAPVQNAMGPSWIDPRTGEILNASVYIYHDVVRLINNWRFIQTAPADPEVRHITLPASYKKEGLRYVVRHEIGHTLGFMHNMAGSYAIPVDSLRSPSFTQTHGLTHSIMDYARYNYIAQPGDKARGVSLVPPKFGLYDYYLVKWNYRYFSEDEDQREILTQMVDEKAGDERYRYGAQGQYLDPSSLTEDLGNNAVRASTYGIKNLKFVMRHLNEWVGEEDMDYAYRQSIRNGIIRQYVRYLNHLYAHVGGIYLNKKYAGDPRPHYQTVSREKQRDAFRMLLEELKNLDWLEREEVIKNLPLSGNAASAVRENLVQALLRAPEKVNLAAWKSAEEDRYTPGDVMEDLFVSIWKKPVQKPTLSKTERELQKAYIQSAITKSGLGGQGSTGAFTFTGDTFKGIPLPDFVKQQGIADYGRGLYQKYLSLSSAYDHALNPVAASFGRADIHFNTRPVLQHVHYTYLMKVKSLMEDAVESAADADTGMHYELLLRNIEKVTH